MVNELKTEADLIFRLISVGRKEDKVLKNSFSLFQTEDGVPNDASGVSDSREIRPQQELFAVGGETEDQPSNTVVEDGTKPQQASSAQQPSQFHEGNNWEICNCTKGIPDVAYVDGCKCPICGKVINLVVEESAATTSTTETESALSQTLTTGMVMVPQTPESPLHDQSATSCEPADQRTLCAVGLDGRKIPIESRYPVHFLFVKYAFQGQVPTMSSSVNLLIPYLRY